MLKLTITTSISAASNRLSLAPIIQHTTTITDSATYEHTTFAEALYVHDPFISALPLHLRSTEYSISDILSILEPPKKARTQ